MNSDVLLVLVVVTALAFDFTNGVDRAIRDVTNEPPLKSDLARVASRLASVGWPLASLENLPVHEPR